MIVILEIIPNLVLDNVQFHKTMLCLADRCNNEVTLGCRMMMAMTMTMMDV